jgi:nucleoside-diphosphate-sugar epimerase
MRGTGRGWLGCTSEGRDSWRDRAGGHRAEAGAALRRALRSDGHEVVVLTRRATGEGQVFWDGERLGSWAREVDGSDVVINLAGRSVSCRYTKGNLTEMMRSRVRSARVVRASGNPVDGGAGRARDPHRHRAAAQEPASRPRPANRGGIRVPARHMARRRPRPSPARKSR